MILPGINKALNGLEKVMNSIVKVRSEYEGTPDFDEDYIIVEGTLVDGEVVFGEATEASIDDPNEDFDMDAMVDNVVHLARGWGFSLEYDAINEAWSMTYRSDNIDHMFLVQGEDLTDVICTGLKAMKDIESDIQIKKTFIEFCEIQLDESEGE